jgi:hypothetical protein
MIFFDRYKDFYDKANEFISTLPEIQKISLNKTLISIAMLITSRGMNETICRNAAHYLVENYIINTDDETAVYYDIIRYCYIVSPDIMNR